MSENLSNIYAHCNVQNYLTILGLTACVNKTYTSIHLSHTNNFQYREYKGLRRTTCHMYMTAWLRSSSRNVFVLFFLIFYVLSYHFLRYHKPDSLPLSSNITWLCCDIFDTESMYHKRDTCTLIKERYNTQWLWWRPEMESMKNPSVIGGFLSQFWCFLSCSPGQAAK